MNDRALTLGFPGVIDFAALSKVLVVLVLALPAVQWLATSQSIWAVPFDRLPKGQFVYLLSKLAALYAIAVFALQVAYGLCGTRARSLLGIERGMGFHRSVGFLVLSLLFTHAALFVAGVTVRTGHFAMQYAVPDIFGGYYISRIALGWWAGVVLIISVVCALGRGWLRHIWRCVHWLSFPAAVAVVVHSLSIGTESRMPLMLIAYGCMAALLFIATFLRIRLAAKSSSGPI
jgi:predicted ferric reductase